MLLDPSRLRRPTREALYAFARAHLPEALRLMRVRAQDVDDAVQEIVEIAYGKVDSFDPGDRDPEAALRRWLGVIAWYYLQNEFARAHRRREVSASDVVEAVAEADEDAGAESPVLCASREERLRIMDRILSTLRPERREVLLLHDGLGLTAEEIAVDLEVNPDTIKSHWRRARREFKAAVERLPPDQRNLLKGPLLGLLWTEQHGASWQERRGLEAAPERGGSALVGIAGAVAAIAAIGMALGPDAASHAAVGAAAHPAPIAR